MFEELERITHRPAPFGVYTTRDLWTDEHTSAQMLACHLDEALDAASRNAAFVARSLEWIVSRFEVGEGTRIADFGCGPGLYANPLARHGARVTGIDFSPRSLDYARGVAAHEGLDTEFVYADYLEFEPEARFDLIMMIMCDFCAMSPDQRGRMLDKFRRLLKPGGSVLLDAYTLTTFAAREEETRLAANPDGGFWAPGAYYEFVSVFKYAREQVMLDKYTIVEAQRTRTIYNWLQYYAPGQIEREFADHGLRVAELIGDVAGSPYDAAATEFAVIASPA